MQRTRAITGRLSGLWFLPKLAQGLNTNTNTNTTTTNNNNNNNNNNKHLFTCQAFNENQYQIIK